MLRVTEVEMQCIFVDCPFTIMAFFVMCDCDVVRNKQLDQSHTTNFVLIQVNACTSGLKKKKKYITELIA